MNLFLSDYENTPDYRIKEVCLLHVDATLLAVWLWIPKLSQILGKKKLFLYNANPPRGGIRSVGICEVKNDWTYNGLTLLNLEKGAFKLHFGDIKIDIQPNPPSCFYGHETLRSVVDTLNNPGQLNLQTLRAIAEYANIIQMSPFSTNSLEAWLSACFLPSATNKSENIPKQHVNIDNRLNDQINLVPLDLWTPGPIRETLVSFYEPLVGELNAEKLWDISQKAISAVAQGDFNKQVSIGRELIQLASDTPYLIAEAAYFEAEGLRLLADLETEVSRKNNFHEQARSKYEVCRELLPQDPRPVRGIGRLLEVQGIYDEAINYFNRSQGLCLIGIALAEKHIKHDLAHEALRTSRHLIHCILEIRNDNHSSVWHREHKSRELEGLLIKCENLHHEYMPYFVSSPTWYKIEWFMGLVFIARAWGQLNNREKVRLSLVYALDVRRKLIPEAGQLSDVECANLKWWLSVAKERASAFDTHSCELLDKIAMAVDNEDRCEVQLYIQDFLRLFLPPWGLEN